LNLLDSRFHGNDDNGLNWTFYPVRNNAPLLPTGQRPSGPAAAAGLDFRIIPAGFNAPLEFLTGFTNPLLLNFVVLYFAVEGGRMDFRMEGCFI
jgi:hypothetical protein